MSRASAIFLEKWFHVCPKVLLSYAVYGTVMKLEVGIYYPALFLTGKCSFFNNLPQAFKDAPRFPNPPST